MEDQKKKAASVFMIFGILVTVVLVSGEMREDTQENGPIAEMDYQEARNATITAIFTDGNDSLAELQLETAETPEEKEKGLMGRKNLAEDSGMLFIWEDAQERNFWMKNTYIPLDMMFLTAEKSIRTIKEADPQPNVSEEDLRIYSSEGPAKYVIEAKQNFTDENNIEEGTQVYFNLTS